MSPALTITYHIKSTYGMYELIENIYFCSRIRILISAYGFNSTHKLPWTLNTHTTDVQTKCTQANTGSEVVSGSLSSIFLSLSRSITLCHAFVCAQHTKHCGVLIHTQMFTLSWIVFTKIILSFVYEQTFAHVLSRSSFTYWMNYLSLFAFLFDTFIEFMILVRNYFS